MAIFEIVYKPQNNKLQVEYIKAIKHGFYLPYAIPFLSLTIGLCQRCLFLSIWSAFITSLFILINNSIFGMAVKTALLVSFSFFASDIKKRDLIDKGYISGGCFVEKSKNKAIKKFFEKEKL